MIRAPSVRYSDAARHVATRLHPRLSPRKTCSHPSSTVKLWIEVSHSDREHPRYAHEAAVKFQVGGKTFEGRTRNVSRGGLCATLVETIPVGTDVELDLVLVFDDDLQSDALRVPAIIVWCTQVDEANQVGVAFRPLDARREQQLDLFLSFLDEQRAEKPRRDQSIDDRFG